MGFRLWVNDDICLGKLYGYTEDSQHLNYREDLRRTN